MRLLFLIYTYDFTIEGLVRVKKQFHVSELFFTLALHIFARTETRQEIQKK